MAPDLNSLPPSSPPVLPAAASRSMHSPNLNSEASIAMGGESPPLASRSGSISLQAAATMNAGLQREPSRPHYRIAFDVWGNSHHRDRAPSLGELHQELEAEQEAQVNRLLQMIRLQQVQLQHLQGSQGQPPSTVAAEDGTPTSELSSSLPQHQGVPTPLSPYPPVPLYRARPRDHPSFPTLAAPLISTDRKGHLVDPAMLPRPRV
ncbi:uncharacterized protein PG998_003293 [Apiospora kogelbergensis]|uniref:uncharacterized protein n=1 Tax=Apiospora kogelbergensis TaxID=1337665 RepID=UPI003131C9A8